MEIVDDFATGKAAATASILPDMGTYEDPEKAAAEPTEAITTAAENFIFLFLTIQRQQC